jgi:hypothetical protein
LSVDVAKDDLRRADAAIVHDRLEPAGLISALEERGSEMDVVQVQLVFAERHVDALAPARLARLPRQIVVRVVKDRVTAQDDVAEEIAAEMAGRRHDPAHAQLGAEFFGVAGGVRPRTDDLLKRDEIGLDRPDHVGDAPRERAPVHAAAPMDVVGRDANGSLAWVGHPETNCNSECRMRKITPWRS